MNLPIALPSLGNYPKTPAPPDTSEVLSATIVRRDGAWLAVALKITKDSKGKPHVEELVLDKNLIADHGERDCKYFARDVAEAVSFKIIRLGYNPFAPEDR